MTTTSDDDFGRRLFADRQARGMSRAAYAELVGLTQTKIANLETTDKKQGRKPKPEELEKLAHLAFAGDGASAPAPEASPPGAEEQQLTIDDTLSDPSAALELTAEIVVERYAEVYARLGGKPVSAHLGWGAEWGTPGQGDSLYWPQIMRWCDAVDAWLDGLQPQEDAAGEDQASPIEKDETDPELQRLLAEEAEIEARIGEEAPPVDDDEIDEELSLAQVTDPPWEFEDDGVKRISNGELKTFKRCRRRWWLAYYRRLGLPTHTVTGAAPLGTRIHRCLAVYYVPGFVLPPQVAFDELERTVAEDLEQIGGDEVAVSNLLKEKDLAHAMLEGYFEWLAETAADQGIDVVAPETKLEVDALMEEQQVHLIAKLDVRATRTFGSDVSRLFIDHKTVGDLTNPTKMLQFDEQMLHYDLCEYLDLLQSGVSNEEAVAVRTDGALYNMLRKVKRTATANPPFYGRVEVRHNVETLRSYWLRVKGEIDEILSLEAKLNAGQDPRQVAYPTPTRDCSWDCDFYHLCTMFDDGSRAEDFIAGNLVEINPLNRYEPTRGE